jgi:hypothetical protein
MIEPRPRAPSHVTRFVTRDGVTSPQAARTAGRTCRQPPVSRQPDRQTGAEWTPAFEEITGRPARLRTVGHQHARRADRLDAHDLSVQVPTVQPSRCPRGHTDLVAETRDLIPRRAEDLVTEALADTRVVLINGARQAGKRTLARLAAARAPGCWTIPPRCARLPTTRPASSITTG